MAAFGNGNFTEMSASEALDVAKNEDVSGFEGDIGDGEDHKAGDAVSVTPNDSGRVPVIGTLVTLNRREIALRHENETVGEVILHFPRAGFVVR